MTEAELERRFLEFVYATAAPITATAVAYYAGCRLDEAQAFLDRLAARGTVQLDSDDSGALLYLMPNRHALAAPSSASHSPGPTTSGAAAPSPFGATALRSGHPRDATAVMVVGPMPTPLALGPVAGPPSPSGSTAPGELVAGGSGHVACPYCSEQILAAARKCKHCGEMLDPALRHHAAGLPIQVNVQTVQTMSPTNVVPFGHGTRVDPGLAAFLSLIWPGAGQIYARHIGAGLAWMAFVVAGYVAYLVPALCLHALCILSATSYARDENRRLGYG